MHSQNDPHAELERALALRAVFERFRDRRLPEIQAEMRAVPSARRLGAIDRECQGIIDLAAAVGSPPPPYTRWQIVRAYLAHLVILSLASLVLIGILGAYDPEWPWWTPVLGHTAGLAWFYRLALPRAYLRERRGLSFGDVLVGIATALWLLLHVYGVTVYEPAG